MSVKKIFMTLIIVVACVIVGALVLNVLVPNATTAGVNAVEGQIKNATGMTFDLNGDSTKGSGQDYSSGKNAEQKNSTVTGSGKKTGVKGID